MRWGLLLVGLLLVLLAIRQVGSHDVGFHLHAGGALLDGAGWPRTDTFTYSVAGKEYVDTSWGFQLLVTLAYRLAGTAGMIGLSILVLLATFVLVERTAALRAADETMLACGMLLAVLMAEIRFEVRPELWSYLYLAGVLYLGMRRTADRPTPLWLLPVVFWLWVNTHSLFPLGWAALACVGAGDALARRRLDRRLLAWGLASIAVVPINPYGLKALTHSLGLVTRLGEENVFAEAIGELATVAAVAARPFYPRLAIGSFWLLLALVLMSAIPLVRRRRYDAALLIVVFAPLAYTAVRNVPLLAVACLPGVAWALPLGSWLEQVAGGIASRWRAALLWALPVTLALVTLLVGLRVIHDAHYIDDRRKARFGVGWNRLVLPVDAAEYAATAGLEGRMLNDLGLGGYLGFRLEQPVFIDGRLEVMGEAFYDSYRGLFGEGGTLEQAVERYDVGWLILRYRSLPEEVLRLWQSRRWQLSYVDHLAMIWTRGDRPPGRTDPSARRVLQVAHQPLPVDDLPGLGGGPRRTGVKRWIDGVLRTATFPTEDYELGQFHYFGGDMQGAETHFGRAIRDSQGAFPDFYNNLGTVLYYQERLEPARRALRVYVDHARPSPFALRTLADIDRRLD